MDKFFVACSDVRGPRGQYFKEFGALEVPNAAGMTGKTLRRWRREAPEAVRFVPHADPVIAEASFVGEAAQAGWARTVVAAKALEADFVFLRTPASFRPTAANRAAIEAFFADRDDGLTVAWSADGLWEGQSDLRDSICAVAGMVPALDPLAADDEDPLPEGDVVYWRLCGRQGLNGRFSDYDLDTLTDLCADRAGGYVVFTGVDMIRDARRFSQDMRAFLAGG